MTTGRAPEVDRPIEQREAAVELVTARDAARSAAEADKAAHRAANEAEKSARQAADEAARVEKVARSLQNGGRRRWRVLGRVSRDSSMDEFVQPDPEPGSGPVTFSDLVRAHRVWELELDKVERRKLESCEESEQLFRLRWRQFEARYGRIDSVYWSVRDASAVALTLERRPLRWVPDHETIPRFHRATDWATRDEPDIAAALDECETLAVRVEEILRGPSELIALRRITAVASHLLGYVDREWFRRAAPHPPPASSQRPHTAEQKDGQAARRQECKAFVKSQRAELARIERFYALMGDGQARILTFWGMVQGLAALVVLTGLIVALIWGVTELEGASADGEHLELFATCVMAGAVGAVLSVLTRMASLGRKFTRNYELGRKNVRWIGIYRPFVGALFGVAAFLLLASGILQTDEPTGDQKLAYFGILALFSGFFERFTTLRAGGQPTPLEKGDDRSPNGGS
jgi:hypothetical protein